MKDVLKKLKQDGEIDEAWTAGLNMMAEYYNTYIQCQRSIKQDGLTIINRFGDRVQHPLIKVSENCSIQLQKLMIEFLLTKKSVIKLPTPPDNEDEEVDIIKAFSINNKVEKR